ncbi:MAG: hypothetical protein WDN76_07380 [Alphaproteobacteria bacterium]
MMGEKAGGQGQLFYQFNLDEVIPTNHLLRPCSPSAPLRQIG